MPGTDSAAAALLSAVHPVHAAILLLRAHGAGDEEISERLALPREVVAPLADLARRKLRRALGGSRERD